MPAIIIVGTQWGDEGKGKITDYLAEDADAGVRYQGGGNAGHTIIVDGRKYVTHNVPSTMVRGKMSMIARGVVLDVAALKEEIHEFTEKGIEINENNLVVDEGASVIMPWHILEDVLNELLKGSSRIGSTAKGIGPSYADRVSRSGLRVVDLLIDDRIAGMLDPLCDTKNLKIRRMVEDVNKMPGYDEKPTSLEKILGELREKGVDFSRLMKEGVHGPIFDVKKITEFYIETARSLAPNVRDVSIAVNEMLREGRVILFEGAQGFGLSYVHGTYPFVTSSNPIAASAMAEVGFSHKYIDRIVGVAKAYTTRVGGGPFCGELADERRLAAEVSDFRKTHGKKASIELTAEEERLIESADFRHPDYDYVLGKALMVWGAEYGATTGRPRRSKWFEAPLVRRAVDVSGISEIVLTKLDVLDRLPKIRMIVGYEYAGERNILMDNREKSFSDFPYSAEIYARCRPIHASFEGWMTDTTKVERFEDLPGRAKEYIGAIEGFVGCRVSMVSVGPDRRQTFSKP